MNIFSRKKVIDMTSGPIFAPLIRYAFPIILTNILQLLYNSADMFVLGNFCDDPNAFGSVGCTGSLINLVLGLFFGLGAGVCVTIGQSIGAGNNERVSKSVHTSVLLSIILGLIVTPIGYFLTPRLLVLMKTPSEFIKGATLYTRIYFCGSVPNLLFNFTSGILRSRGDTVRPLIFSSVGGVLNIFLNIFLVTVFGMGVDGVAIATVISQLVSAILSVYYMMKLTDSCKLSLNKLEIDRSVLSPLIRIGVPAGVQGMLFSFSNVLLQSSYNNLGSLYVNANTAASNVDAYIETIMNAFYNSSLTFSSHNFGAKKPERLKKVFYISAATITAIGFFLGVLVNVFAKQLVSIFNSDPDVIEVAKSRLLVVGLPYFLCGLMNIGMASLRSIGYSLLSTLITFLGSCVFRIIWIYTIYTAFNGILMLYIVYPISWTITFTALAVAFFIMLKRETKKWAEMNLENIRERKSEPTCF